MRLHFKTATSVYRKTLPFVVLRLGIGLLCGLLAVVYFGAIAWFGTRLLESSSISELVAFVGLVLAVGLFVAGWRLFSRYVLYLVKVAHIAVIAHVIETGEVPPNQIRYGKSQVTEHFTEASALFAVDQLVKAVIKQFNGAVVSFSELLSIVPNLQKLVELLGKAITIAASYIDEAIIAHMFCNPEQNRWRSARDGIVLYGKTWKSVLASTLAIVVGLYALAFVLVLALIPVATGLGNLGGLFEVLGWVIALGTALTIYTGFLKPWVKTVVITTFLLESRDIEPDSETMDRVASRSERFRELVGNTPERTDQDSQQAPSPNLVTND
ncbi:hypothetical protein HALLA_12565 [Halostagnicola larsenii XH-48]|uniref:Uncharacterized protein n=1 Tax=Halostagnicola larsenii XH-48 TaxID=797299 RepID=W0JL74_9EURY|nr:hypothetical protein [Halostagnicola larsenii]AHF99495.1 hypothetical protein HALLA_12565 [Halostagnicola larsenii XH-48]